MDLPVRSMVDVPEIHHSGLALEDGIERVDHAVALVGPGGL